MSTPRGRLSVRRGSLITEPNSVIFERNTKGHCRSWWPCGLRRGSAAAPLLGWRVRVPPGAWLSGSYFGNRGSTVVKVLCYKSEGRWFDPSWCQWIFIHIKSFRSHYGPGVDSASNRNEYQDYFLGVKTAGA